MTREEAAAQIAHKLAQIDVLYAECAKLGFEHQIAFQHDGATYGAGVMYDWNSSDGMREEGGWLASSQSC